ncbi:prepilin-type N-terminal cleavage/methylation domain-containing protein [Pseudoalteromonas sp.]|uniref:type IV pilus modification PilV family protein n=1 Tax=Pseudoalteromonas sp. TaxID=53249 RepID=UPI003569EEFA
MNSNKGFTLIEVLVASLILFASLALIAELFGSSFLTSHKASSTTRLYQIAPIAVAGVKSQLRSAEGLSSQSDVSGTLTVQGVRFNWQAKLLDRVQPPEFLGDVGEKPKLYGRYHISVVALTETREVPFDFEVATW